MELNAEQIKKALECCTSPDGDDTCLLCPYGDINLCTQSLMAHALALITSQEQRIKELTEDVAEKVIALVEFDKQITRLTEENERLTTALAKYDLQTEVRIAENYYTAEAYEELTAALEAVRSRADETIDALHSEVRELTDENERLQKALNTDISVVRVVSRGSGKTAHLHEVMRIKVDAVRATAVREFSDRFISELRKDGRMNYYIRKVLDQIAKEMLEGANDT